MTGQEIEENTLVNRWVGEYIKEKKKCEELEKDYKLLNEKYEQALNEYDELLQDAALQKPDCKNCENDLMLKLSDAEIKCDKLQWYYDKLNMALDIKEELNKALREENEELKNKLRVTKNDRERHKRLL